MLHRSPYKRDDAGNRSPPSSTTSLSAPTTTTNSSIGRRSNAGCWTCRLRKKKCDETHPLCKTCTSLDIPCYSYGPKPDWMHNEQQEKKVKQEIKRLVNLSVRRRMGRQQSSGDRQSSSEMDSYCLVLQQHEPEPASMISYAPVRALSQELSDPEIYSQNFHQTMTPSTHQDISTIPPPLPMQDQIGNCSSPLTFIPGPGGFPTPASLPMAPCEDLMMMPDEPFPLQMASFTPPKNRNAQEDEMALLAYYLDFVFYAQFPFYRPQTWCPGRGWLLSLLMNRGTSYHACLSISASYQLALLPQDEPDREGTIDVLVQSTQRCLELAIQEIQSNINLLGERRETSPGETSVVDLLFGMLQLNFLSVAGRLDARWQMHLQASSTVIPTVLVTPSKRLSLMKDVSDNHAGVNNDHHIISERPIADGPAVRFLLSAFVHLDIIASASTCTPCSSPLDHIRLLETGEVNMTSVCGCRNWAMAAVAKVCEMNEWKITMELEGRLSTRVLVGKAAVIEQSILTQIAEMLGNSDCKVVHRVTETQAEHVEKLITTVFALGALTYLNVIVSGTLPGLAEIEDTVSKMVEILRRLLELNLINQVIWPFCVAGCLATEEHHAFFANLDSPPPNVMGESIVSRQGKALEIVRGCWAMRRLGNRLCRWADVEGPPVLLV
ncbi:C6 transcription factor [Phlyctema vagabunda]|uniref:C6 transcription factor n=1 Tax=Phlyctema vagabunda TaxID=108571 RepID=A0ABR4PB17_9HELO